MIRSRLFSVASAASRGALRTISSSTSSAASASLYASSSAMMRSFSSIARPASIPSFHVARRFQSSSTSKDLAQILTEEKTYELEHAENDDSFIKDFLAKSSFKLQDTPRKMEVIMKRKHENEEVTIFFTVESTPPVESFEDEEGGEGEDMEHEPQPVPFTVIISKPTGAITFNCDVDMGSILIHQVVFTGDSKLALADNATADYDRTNIYPGPNFTDLDERLQDALDAYLFERIGDGEELANFIPAYIDFKEQNEYVNWLGDIEGFLRK